MLLLYAMFLNKINALMLFFELLTVRECLREEVTLDACSSCRFLWVAPEEINL